MSEKLLGYRSWTADEKSYKIHQDQYMYNNLVSHTQTLNKGLHT